MTNGSYCIFSVLTLATMVLAQDPPGAAEASSDIQVNDIVVTLERCILQNGEARTELPGNAQVRVIAISGDLVGCAVLIDGREKKGWIKTGLVTKTTPPSTSRRIRSGDTVVALDNSALRLGQQVVVAVPRGARLQVKSVSGDWLGCSIVTNGREEEGWIANRLVTRAPETNAPPLHSEQAAGNPAPSAQSQPDQQAPIRGDVLPIWVEGDGRDVVARARLILAVSWTFSSSPAGPTLDAATIDPGTERIIENPTSGKPCALIGPSGLAKPTGDAVSLAFSSIHKTVGEPMRAHFRIETGSLDLWWEAKSNIPAGDRTLKLSRGWLANASALPASPSHPLGGIRIGPVGTRNLLELYVEFDKEMSFPPRIAGIGTSP